MTCGENGFVARELAPARLRSSRTQATRSFSYTVLAGLGALRTPAGASSLATEVQSHLLCCYRVKVKRFTNAPGNNIEAVARWL